MRMSKVTHMESIPYHRESHACTCFSKLDALCHQVSSILGRLLEDAYICSSARSSAEVSGSTKTGPTSELETSLQPDDSKDLDIMDLSGNFPFAISIYFSLFSFAQSLAFRYAVAPCRIVSELLVMVNALS